MYCLGCRQEAEINDESVVEEFVSRNGRRMKRATCGRCGKVATCFERRQAAAEAEEAVKGTKSTESDEISAAEENGDDSNAEQGEDALCVSVERAGGDAEGVCAADASR